MNTKTIHQPPRQHGGRRPGAGRKRVYSKGVAHRTREFVNEKTPMHINFRYKTQIRNKESLKILKRALLNASRKGLRIHHFSMQSNHVHLIVEAKDNGVLSRGMRSLTVTFAKGLKKGRIQLGRYHLHVLRAVSEARNAVRYVLLNEQKHTRSRTLRVDGYSSLGSLGHEFIRRFIRKEKLSLIWKPEGQKINPAPSSWLLKKSIEILV